MTSVADLEVRMNKFVSCFSNLILLPMDHSPGLIYRLEEVPVWNMCSFQLNDISVKERKLDWFGHHDCVLVLHECHNRFVLILTILHSGFVSRTTKCTSPLFCPKSEFAQHWACLSKHDPIALLRRIHDNLYIVGSSWSAWRCLRIHNPLG